MGFINTRKQFIVSFCQELSKQYDRPYGESEMYRDLDEIAENT
jgi:hypothetical protein